MADELVTEPDTGNQMTDTGKLDLLEREFLKLPQADCPVVHRFGPGIYIREVTVQAGVYAIGHRQRLPQLNNFLRGRVTVINDDGSRTELIAPLTFVGPAGRKVGYVHETMVWQNIYATTETDIEKLEAMFLDKSEGWHEARARQEVLRLGLDEDVADYHRVLAEFGFTHEVARRQSEDESDQVPFPHGSYAVGVFPSRIEGRGLHATARFEPGDVIAPARIAGKRTPAGRYTNHSRTPNAAMVMRAGGDIDLVATQPLRGCAGGELGDEITIDYRDALRLQVKET